MLGHVVWALTTYEAHAIESGRLPTITRLVRRWRHISTVRMLVGALLVAVWWHLFVQEDFHG